MGKRKKLQKLKELRDELQTQHDRVDLYLKNASKDLDNSCLEAVNLYRGLVIKRINYILEDKSR